MIFKFNEFINEGVGPQYSKNSRAEVLDMSFEQAIEKYAPWYDINCEEKLYRASDNENNVNLISPSEFKRYTIGDKNSIYQHFLNEQSGWGDRSKSVIMSTSDYGIRMYGDNVFRVIPIKKDSMIYMAPTRDIWSSFDTSEYDKFFVQECYGSLSLMNSRLQTSIFYRNKIDLENIKIDGIEYYFDMASENIKYKRLLIDEEPEINMDIENIIKPGKVDKFLSEYKGGIFELVSKVVNYNNPKKDPDDASLSFIKMKYDGNKKRTDDRYRECWTEAPCLLIKEELLS